MSLALLLNRELPLGPWRTRLIGLLVFLGLALFSLLIGFGLAWAALSAVTSRTNFFSLETRMDADKFGIALAVILGVAVLIIALLQPHLPRSDVAKLPPNPAIRERTLRVESNFRVYVSMSVLLAGVALASIPAIRFFKH